MVTKIFDGKKITIRKLSGKDIKIVKKLQDFINSVVAEDAQIAMNKKASLKEERNWLKWELNKIKRKKEVFLVAEHNNLIVGTTDISLNIWRQEHVGVFGIIIRKGYRAIGLGTYLAKEIIKLAKKELKPKPKVIRLSVFPTNKPAQTLYKKMGFRKVAVIPKQTQYKEKLVDDIIMLLYL